MWLKKRKKKKRDFPCNSHSKTLGDSRLDTVLNIYDVRVSYGDGNLYLSMVKIGQQKLRKKTKI